MPVVSLVIITSAFFHSQQCVVLDNKSHGRSTYNIACGPEARAQDSYFMFKDTGSLGPESLSVDKVWSSCSHTGCKIEREAASKCTYPLMLRRNPAALPLEVTCGQDG